MVAARLFRVKKEHPSKPMSENSQPSTTREDCDIESSVLVSGIEKEMMTVVRVSVTVEPVTEKRVLPKEVTASSLLSTVKERD